MGPENCQLEDFWKIYRNVLKKVDFYVLQKKFGFDEFLQRHAKTNCFTDCLSECLQEQIGKNVRFEFSMYNKMSYP
jgi:predicted acetyltransferase